MLKEEILTILQESKGSFVSGQILCNQLGVTRTAVWKNILLLRKEGYLIEAVTKKGYCLTDDSMTYNAFEITKELRKSGLDMEVLFQNSVDSTNLWAFEVSNQYDNVLLVADEQTHGKGRRGRSWSSLPGCGIWMSYLMKPKIQIGNASMITLVFALAIAHAITKVYERRVEIKWPNDIVYRGKKICGILTEMRSDTDGIRALVCGIGINANTTDFPKELESVATSLKKSFGVPVSRVKLISEIMKHFDVYFGKFLKTEDLSELKAEYEEILANRDKDVFLIGEETAQKVFCKGINNRGELVVIDENRREMQIHSGEVSVRGIYGYV